MGGPKYPHGITASKARRGGGGLVFVLVLALLSLPDRAWAADTSPPTGTVVINAGAAATNSRTVTLTLAATDDQSAVTQMRFSNTGSSFSKAEAYATTKTWTLSSGAGTKTVYVQFKDAVGNWSSAPITDTIVLDTTAPTDLAANRDGITSNQRHDHLDHERARDLASRLRTHHQLRLDDAARPRLRRVAQRRAERPDREHDVQLPRPLARRRGQRTRQRQQHVQDGRRGYGGADGAVGEPSRASPTNAGSVSWTVTFSEAVTGVDTSDFALVTPQGSVRRRRSRR